MEAVNIIEEDTQGMARNVEQQFAQTMLNHLLAEIEMGEIYSPPRVTDMVRRMGLRAGWALDITTRDKDGRE